MVFRAAYDRLANAALAKRQCRWAVRPKDHFVEHLVLDYRGLGNRCLNGRLCQNFLNEDFMRRVKALAVGSHPGFLSKHVTFKYLLQLTLRWR